MSNFRIIDTTENSKLEILEIRVRHQGNVYDDILF